jgi:hypothetical protein
MIAQTPRRPANLPKSDGQRSLEHEQVLNRTCEPAIRLAATSSPTNANYIRYYQTTQDKSFKRNRLLPHLIPILQNPANLPRKAHAIRPAVLARLASSVGIFMFKTPIFNAGNYWSSESNEKTSSAYMSSPHPAAVPVYRQAQYSL